MTTMNIHFYNACMSAEDVPARVNITESGVEIICANADGLALTRDQLVAATSNAEIEQIESDLFDKALDEGLVEFDDWRNEAAADYRASTGYPFGGA